MGKITRIESKAHDDALALLSMTRALTHDEREFVFRNYNPMATNNVGKAAIFFTPFDLASDMMLYLDGIKGRLLDAFAGIGVLGYQAWIRYQRELHELVCVEINPEFVEVGKKVLPEATWVWGDMFDLNLVAGLGLFNQAVSNPPYGSVATTQETSWLKYKGPAQLKAAEIFLRITDAGATMILPRIDQSHFGDKLKRPSTHYQRWAKAFPGAIIAETSTPIEGYQDQWQGASPDVVMAELLAEITKDGIEMPMGLPLQPAIWQIMAGAHRENNRREEAKRKKLIGEYAPFDFVRLWDEGENVITMSQHEQAVRQALKDGEKVPSWALATYPHLQPEDKPMPPLELQAIELRSPEPEPDPEPDLIIEAQPAEPEPQSTNIAIEQYKKCADATSWRWWRGGLKERKRRILLAYRMGAMTDETLWRLLSAYNGPLHPKAASEVYIALGFVPFAGYPLERIGEKPVQVAFKTIPTEAGQQFSFF